MHLLTKVTPVVLWQEVIRFAEARCSIILPEEIEAYLIALLMRYINKPDVAQQIFATKFMKALQQREYQRHLALQVIGDQCLLYAGFFPRAAQRRHVKLRYFVDLGRSAYANIAEQDNLYHSLALRFVSLMDILQSIPEYSDLMPQEAQEQWQSVGSKRAKRIIESFILKGIVPIKKA